MTMDYHLAHLNVARLLAPLEDPMIKDFKDGLEFINKKAEQSSGFIWRLKEDPIMPDDSSYVFMGDPSMIFTLSVWESLDALKDFTYEGDHASYFKRRKEWFHKMVEANYVLWWINTGHQPSISEAVSRLKFLRLKGESQKAFTFKTADKWVGSRN